MLSIQWIREAPDEVREMLARRGATAPVDEVLALDGERRSILTEVEQLKAERNQAGKAIGQARDAAARDALIAAQRAGAGRIDALDERRRAVDAQLHDLLAQFPNRLHPDTPDGRGEAGQPGAADGGAAAGLRLRAQAALGDRRGAAHPRDRARGPRWRGRGCTRCGARGRGCSGR